MLPNQQHKSKSIESNSSQSTCRRDNNATNCPRSAEAFCRAAWLMHRRSQVTEYHSGAWNRLNVVNCGQLYGPVKGFAITFQQFFIIRHLPTTYANPNLR